MMASVILIFSLATLFMFFVSYCRSLTASTAREPLSEEVRDVTGIETSGQREVYPRVIQLLQLCPSNAGDPTGLSAVQLYYSIVDSIRKVVSVPAVVRWTDHEQMACAHYAAVTLDRRIRLNREMLLASGPDE